MGVSVEASGSEGEDSLAELMPRSLKESLKEVMENNNSCSSNGNSNSVSSNNNLDFVKIHNLLSQQGPMEEYWLNDRFRNVANCNPTTYQKRKRESLSIDRFPLPENSYLVYKFDYDDGKENNPTDSSSLPHRDFMRDIEDMIKNNECSNRNSQKEMDIYGLWKAEDAKEASELLMWRSQGKDTADEACSQQSECRNQPRQARLRNKGRCRRKSTRDFDMELPLYAEKVGSWDEEELEEEEEEEENVLVKSHKLEDSVEDILTPIQDCQIQTEASYIGDVGTITTSNMSSLLECANKCGDDRIITLTGTDVQERLCHHEDTLHIEQVSEISQHIFHKTDVIKLFTPDTRTPKIKIDLGDSLSLKTVSHGVTPVEFLESKGDIEDTKNNEACSISGIPISKAVKNEVNSDGLINAKKFTLHDNRNTETPPIKPTLTAASPQFSNTPELAVFLNAETFNTDLISKNILSRSPLILERPAGIQHEIHESVLSSLNGKLPTIPEIQKTIQPQYRAACEKVGDQLCDTRANEGSMLDITCDEHSDCSRESHILEQEKKDNTWKPKRNKMTKMLDSELEGAGTSLVNGVRRSTRIRSRPLEYWRGERFLFGRAHDSFRTVIGIKYSSPSVCWSKRGSKA